MLSSKLRVPLVFSVHPLISGIPWFYKRRLSMCTVQSAELCSEESWGLLWGLSLKALLEPPPSGQVLFKVCSGKRKVGWGLP